MGVPPAWGQAPSTNPSLAVKAAQGHGSPSPSGQCLSSPDPTTPRGQAQPPSTLVGIPHAMPRSPTSPRAHCTVLVPQLCRLRQHHLCFPSLPSSRHLCPRGQSPPCLLSKCFSNTQPPSYFPPSFTLSLPASCHRLGELSEERPRRRKMNGAVFRKQLQIPGGCPARPSAGSLPTSTARGGPASPMCCRKAEGCPRRRR